MGTRTARRRWWLETSSSRLGLGIIAQPRCNSEEAFGGKPPPGLSTAWCCAKGWQPTAWKTMSEENNDRFNLSRRKALAGLGGIGAATALGGIGTMAQFTDTEEESITFTAGGVDGEVEGHASYNGNAISDFYGNTQELDNVSDTEGTGALGLNISFDDVKPGDFGCFSFKVTVDNNPAWVGSCIGYSDSNDGEVFEPEVDEDDDLSDSQIGSQGVDSDGELPQNMLVIPFYKGHSAPADNSRWDPCTFFDPEEDVFTPEGYDGLGAVSTPSAFWSNSENGLLPSTLEDVSDAVMVDSSTWNSNGSEFDAQTDDYPDVEADPGCMFLNGAEPSIQNQQGAAPLQPNGEIWFGFDWHIPFDVGNEAQGDTMDLDLAFQFSQIRHTESAVLHNVYSPGSSTPN